MVNNVNLVVEYMLKYGIIFLFFNVQESIKILKAES